jgi:hypothetical protein
MNATLSPIKLRKTFSHAKFSKMHSNALLAWLRLYDAKNGCYTYPANHKLSLNQDKSTYTCDKQEQLIELASSNMCSTMQS